jgi:hypothetical protein
MKKLILLLVIICPLFSFGQTITLTNVDYTYSGVAVERSLINFILMLNMDQDKFESEMKKAGNSIDITSNFCVRASEQVGMDWINKGGEIGTSKCLIFTKCADRLIVMWYGSEKGSGLKQFVSMLQPHFIERKGDDNWYAYKYNDKVYELSLSRTSDDGETYFESLRIFKQD